MVDDVGGELAGGRLVLTLVISWPPGARIILDPHEREALVEGL